MTQKSDQMSRLMQVTEAAYAAEQSHMTRLIRQEMQIRQQIAALNAARRSQDRSIDQDYAALVGADFRWQRWVDVRVTQLNTTLAKTLVEKDRVRTKLTRAFGKYQIAGHLFEQTKISDRKIAEKRAERNA